MNMFDLILRRLLSFRINSLLLSDHLGSTSVVTNVSGGVVSRTGYYPFGETRYTTGTLNTDKLYTGLSEPHGSEVPDGRWKRPRATAAGGRPLLFLLCVPLW